MNWLRFVYLFVVGKSAVLRMLLCPENELTRQFVKRLVHISSRVITHELPSLIQTKYQLGAHIRNKSILGAYFQGVPYGFDTK